MERTDSLTQRLQILRHNDSHQRAGVIDADFKTGPTAGSVACDCYLASVEIKASMSRSSVFATAGGWDRRM